MTKTRSTKSALISSVIALLLCFTMLLGTTFAWFTDSVTSANNVIKSGTLNVEMYYADGTKAVPADDSADWKNADGVAIYTADQLWEPGYTDAKHIKISNEGTLALKYQLAIVPTGEVSELAEVIDVYLYEIADTDENATHVATRDDVDPAMYVGTLADVISKGIVQGTLAADTDYTTTIVLKMRENAGNEYQDKSIGDDFTIQLLATQLNSEKDSFDADYDKDAWMDGMQVYTASDLQAAINAGETNITLAADIELDEPIVIPASTTTYSMRSATPATVIDLNGKTITGNVGRDADGNRVHVIVNNGNAVIKNGVITSAGVNGGSAIYNADGATLTVENVTLNGAPQEGSTWPSYTVNNYGTLTVSDSSIYGVQGIIATNNTANTTVNNVIAYRDGWSSGHVFYTSSTAKVTINGGTYTNDGNGVDGTMIYGGETVVNGGTFIVKEGAYFALCSGSKLTVNGGNFSNIKSCIAWGGAMTISDGTFGFNPTTYVADGYQVVTETNGTYRVLPVIEGVELTATEFAGIYAGDTAKTYYVFDKTGLMNLNELFAAITPNEGNINTVNLMADVDLAGEDWEPLTTMWVIFNGNGHTVSNLTANGMDATGRRSGFWGYAGAVTINDLTLENVTVNGSQAGTFAGSAEGLKINNCFLKGDNVVNYVDGVEEWNGIGAISGVVQNSNMNVTIADGATVTLNKTGFTTDAGCTFVDNLTGYMSANQGTIVDNGKILVVGASSAADLDGTLASGGDIVMGGNMNFNASETSANSGYGATGVSVKGGVLDGNGHSLGINNWGTWDAAVHTTGGTIKNLTVNSGMRGIFMGSATADVYIENVVIDGTIYTFNSDGGSKDYGVYISNSTLNGWTSFSDVHKEVVFTNCNFGEGQGYAFCRPYNAATFTNCVFEEGYEIQAVGAVVLDGCYYGETLITAENIDSLGLIVGGADKVTVK